MAKNPEMQTSRILNAPQKGSEIDEVTYLRKRILDLENQNKELNAEKPITIYFNKSINRLAVLNRIGASIASLQDMNEISQYVVKAVAEELNANRVSLMVLDKDSNELVIRASVGLSHKIARSSRVKLGRRVSGWVAKHAQPVLVENIHEDERFKPKKKGEFQYATDSFISAPMILSVPIQFKGAVVGVMNANDKKDGKRFDEDDLIFLSTVAAQAAIAIENSRLFEQLRLSEQEQESLQQQLFQAQKLEALGELLTGITHELNNRLAPVLAYAQILQTMHQDERSHKYLKTIEESILDSKSIIESMVTFARPRLPNWEMTDVNQVIGEALLIVKYELHKHNIEIHKELHENLPQIMADPEQLKLVLINILNNAHYSMEKSGGQIYVRSYQVDGTLKIEIEDAGCGISPENLTKIFDPFFTTKEVGKGTGLGLSVCYGVIKAHHGKIDVQSEEKKGSLFTISLPLDEKGRSQYTVSTETQVQKEPEPARKRILLIDDDKLILETMSEILKTENKWKIVLARNGNEAVRYLKQQSFDVIVSDLRMPKMDGMKLYKWIVENAPGYMKRIIYTTGDIHDSKTREFLENHNIPFLAKPFNIREFKKRISKNLEIEL